MENWKKAQLTWDHTVWCMADDPWLLVLPSLFGKARTCRAKKRKSEWDQPYLISHTCYLILPQSPRHYHWKHSLRILDVLTSPSLVIQGALQLLSLYTPQICLVIMEIPRISKQESSVAVYSRLFRKILGPLLINASSDHGKDPKQASVEKVS